MKQRINFIVDILMFLLLAAMTGLGFLMKYVLIPGKDRLAKFGRQADLYFWGWDRHEWGAIHLILGFAMLGFLAIHIVLHWKSIRCLFRRLIDNKALRTVLTIVFSLLCLSLVAFPFMVNIELRDVMPGQGHQRIHHPAFSDSLKKQTMDDSSMAGFSNPLHSSMNLKQEIHEMHDHHDTDIRVYGSMSIEQVASTFQIPADSILAGLGIDLKCSPKEKLGRLRKRYSFQMTDVEKIILLYKTKINR